MCVGHTRHPAIKAIEKRVKDAKAKQKLQKGELADKMVLKRSGADAFKTDQRKFIEQIDYHRARLDPASKADKKTITALDKDRARLEARIARTDALLTAIGGQLNDEEARTLILKRIDDLARAELTRYLNAETRALIAHVENLWGKYADSSRELEAARGETLKELDAMLGVLGYLR